MRPIDTDMLKWECSRRVFSFQDPICYAQVRDDAAGLRAVFYYP